VHGGNQIVMVMEVLWLGNGAVMKVQWRCR